MAAGWFCGAIVALGSASLIVLVVLFAADKDTAPANCSLKNEDRSPTQKVGRGWVEATIGSSRCATNTAKPLELGPGLSARVRAEPVQRA